MIAVRPHRLHNGARPAIIGADQPDYIPLPASMSPDGVVMTEWELTAEELQRVLEGGRLRAWQFTGNQPLQPQAFEIAEPVS